MAIKIKFDASNNPILPTLLLAKKDGTILGLIEARKPVVSDSMNDVSEITFEVHKYEDNKRNYLWDEIIDFRLLWCKEWNRWFEITVKLNELDDTTKFVTCTNLGSAELSQIMLFNIEINTETDIARDDYKIPTVLYSQEHPEASLLNRLLEKAPHYTVKHVDYTVMSMQRTFSFSDVSIYDAFSQISEECDVLFVIDVESDNNGGFVRTISVYDLESYCNSCEHRGIFEEYCTECNSDDIHEGYGDDTSILISPDMLGNQIEYYTNTESVKNCFKLEAGDELMTATIANCNPNGTDYIWYIPDYAKSDMSFELVEKLNNYDNEYEYYRTEYQSVIDANCIDRYNQIVTKYKSMRDDLKQVESPIVGYTSLIGVYYDVIDFGLYLKSGMMPSIEISDTNADEQISLLTSANLSPVSVSNINIASTATVNSAVLSMAKLVVHSGYQVKIDTSSYSDNIWTGTFVVTNYSDSEDTAKSKNSITVSVDDNYTNFVKHKLDRSLDSSDKDNYGIGELFNNTLEVFKNEIKKYSLNYLTSLHDACQACLDILIEQGIGDKSSWDSSDIESENLYNDLYLPYYNKLDAIESELNTRQAEIDIVSGVLDNNGLVEKNGLKTYIVYAIQEIQDALNFQRYIGDTLWTEFCTFRREQKYSNTNYISTGLTNAELILNAKEFIDVAKKEIYKSAELQHQITGSLKNFLMIREFSSLVDYFSVGNWIRVKIDESVYKLRLLSYQIDYENPMDIVVTFSDVIKEKNDISDLQSVYDQTKQMATSYESVKRQAGQGANGNNVLNNWFESGLDATLTKIINNVNNVTMSWDEHGMLFRHWDDFLESYSDEQLKIINSTIAMTDDSWKSIRTALGKFFYRDPVSGNLKETYGVNAETIVGKFIIGKNLAIYNDEITFRINEEGLYITNEKNTVTINPNSESVFTITNSENEDIISFDDDGNGNFKGHLRALSLSAGGKISPLTNVNGTYIDYDGNIYSGSNNQVKILSDGTFDFGCGGIVYNGSNLTVTGAIIAQTLTSGNKVSKDSQQNGTFIDSDGSIYVGSDNEVIFNSDGTFNIGKDAIIYDGETVTLGSSVTLKWENILDADSKITSISQNEISTATISANQIYAGSIKSTDAVTTIINLDDGTFSFASGNLKYEDSRLSVNGNVTATSLTATSTGTIACWSFDSTCIYKTSSSHGDSTGMYFGNDGLSIKNKFVVDSNGNVSAAGTLDITGTGTISAWTFSGTALYRTSADFGNSSGMYFGTNGLSITDKFKVTSGGTLTATNATLTGSITANTGYIGGTNGFTISTGYMYSGSKTSYNSSKDGVYIGTDGIGVGSDKAWIKSDGQFSFGGSNGISYDGTTIKLGSKVDASSIEAGSVKAENITGTTITGKTFSGCTGTFSGTITAGSGSVIGGFTIGTSKISATGKDGYTIEMQKYDGSNYWVFGAGGKSHSDYIDCPFRVRYDGKLYASGAEIDGKITMTSGFIGGDSGGWRVNSSSIRRFQFIDSTTGNTDVDLYYQYTIQAPNGATSNMLYIRSTAEKPSSGTSAKDWEWTSNTNWFYKFYIDYNGSFVFRNVDSYHDNGMVKEFSQFSMKDGFLQNVCYYYDSNGKSTYPPADADSMRISGFRANNFYTTGSNTRCYTDYRADGIDYRGKNFIQFTDSSTGLSGLVTFNTAINIGTGSIRATNDETATIADCTESGRMYFGASSAYTDESSLTCLRGKTVRIYSHISGAVYLGSSGSTAISSDEHLKDIYEMDERYVNFFNNLNPVAYKYKVGHRKHLGFGARAVEQALKEADMTTEDFAGILIDKNVKIGKDEMISPDGATEFDELYSLRYEEFVALNTMMIKGALAKIAELEKEIKKLKG